MKETHTHEITLKRRLKRQKLTKKKKRKNRERKRKEPWWYDTRGRLSRKAHDSSLDVGLIFIFCRWSNRPTSCNYTKENNGMKKCSKKRKMRRKRNGKEKKRRNEGREKSASVRKRKWREKSLLRRSIDGEFDTANDFVARSMPLIDRERKIVYATTIIRIAST